MPSRRCDAARPATPAGRAAPSFPPDRRSSLTVVLPLPDGPAAPSIRLPGCDLTLSVHTQNPRLIASPAPRITMEGFAPVLSNYDAPFCSTLKQSITAMLTTG